MFDKYDLYLVGGYIRDELLGLESKDIDYTVVYSGELTDISEVFKYFAQELRNQGYSVFLETPECLTIRAKFPPHHPNSTITADFVLARKETYDDPNSRTPTVSVGTLEDDLIRRDMTVNALARDMDGNLIDLFGGVKDLENKLLRCPIDAKTSFMDDPLRAIRALRFQVTKGFRLDDDIINVLENDLEMWSKYNRVVSKERTREELHKMFKHDSILAMITLNRRIPDYILPTILGDIWFKPTLEK